MYDLIRYARFSSVLVYHDADFKSLRSNDFHREVIEAAYISAASLLMREVLVDGAENGQPLRAPDPAPPVLPYANCPVPPPDPMGVPSSAVEGLAWNVVLEVVAHLRELRDLGDAGPSRQPGWSESMEGGIDGMLDTLGRCFACFLFSAPC